MPNAPNESSSDSNDTSGTDGSLPRDSAASTRVSRGWIILGSVAMLLGLLMGFVMSSLGK